MSTQNNSGNQATKPAVPARTEITQSKHGKLIIGVELQRLIQYHHEQVGTKEWCGILFYKHLEGEFDDPSTLVFEATDFYLMDVGRETYTEAEMDPDSIIDKWNTLDRHYGPDDDPDARYADFKAGLIHTHHKMDAFFSGTDLAELRESTPAHNYYLSLIVNFNGKWVAKVAFIAKREISMKYKGTKDVPKNFVEETEVLMMIDLDIIKEQEEVAIPDFFRARYAAVKRQGEERAQAAATKYTSNAGNYTANNNRFTPKDAVEDAWDEYYRNTGTPDEQEEGSNTSTGANTSGSKTNSTVGRSIPISQSAISSTPPSKLELEVTEKILDWLVEGCDIYGDMVPKSRFGNISEAMRFFEGYFDKVGHSSQECKYWVEKMQRNMEMFFKYHPKTVERLGTEAMTFCAYSDNASIAVELHTLFESYPLYVKELEKATKGNKREKNNVVHARKKY